MKKIFALLLAASLVLSFAACSGDEPEVHDHDHDHEQEEIPSETDPEEEPEEEITEVDAQRGSINEYIYQNEAFGISFEADSDWYYYSDEEIAATMGAAAEQMLSEDYAEMINEANIIYDMYCANLSTGSTVNINYENLGLLYGMAIDEEYYLEISKTQFDSQVSGLNIVKNEIGKATINGEEVPCLNIILDFSGMQIFETIVVQKTANWMGVVTVAGVSEEEVTDVLTRVSFN